MRSFMILVLGLISLAAGETASPWRSEEHWLVDSTVRQIVRWGVPAGQEPTVAVKAGDAAGSWNVLLGGASARTVAIALAHHQWSAEDFLPLAQALLPKDGAKPTDAAAEQRLLERLLAPITPTLLAEDARVSALLVASPADPGAHEQAALLLACLAYREAAGVFADSRLELCAATAQLALARAQRPQPGPCAQVAEALIDAIVGRAQTARAAADAWPKPAPWGAWARAVRLRAGADWKADGCAASATLIERLAHARALALRQRCGGCAAWVEEQKGLPEIPDWGRLVCEGGVDVENGHAYARGGFPADVAEVGLVWAHFHPETPFKAEHLATALSASPGAGAPVRILSEARWSLFLSRHLGHRLRCIHEHAVTHWGVAEAAAEISTLCAGSLARLPVMPAIRSQLEGDPARAEQAMKAVEAAVRRPELLGPWVRWSLARAPDTKAAAARLAPAPAWLGDVAPRGTAYQALGRIDLLGGALPDTAGRIEALLAFGNREPCLRQRLAALRIPAKAADRGAQLAKMYGEDAGIDLALAKEIAYASTGEARIQALKGVAIMDPGTWNSIARELTQAKRQDEAMEALEQLFRHGRNRVQVANNTEPLIIWHAEHQRLDRAKEIAAHNYEVFSYRGIASKANLDERLGDLDAAEACWKALGERYEDQLPLIRFWQRTADKRPTSRQALDAHIAAAFPQGQRRVKTADFTLPPTKGVEITSDSDLLRKHRLAKGHIIVAIDGIACDNQAQFLTQRDMADGTLRLIVWDGKAYREVAADLPDRRFGVNLADFPAAKQVR